MSRRLSVAVGTVALTLAGWLLTPADAAAQIRGRIPRTVYNYDTDAGRYGDYFSPYVRLTTYTDPRFYLPDPSHEGVFFTSPISPAGPFAPAPPELTPLTANLTLRVPRADAEVLIDDRPTQQTGLVRQYVSPPLQRGRSYKYEVRVIWVENGKKVERKETVTVLAGRTTTITFLGG